MRKFRLIAALALLLAPADAGLFAQKPGAGDAAPADQSVIVRPDDPEMNAAKSRAIRELPAFFARLAAPASDETGFEVKFDIAPGEDQTIYVWAGQLDRSRVPMTGVLMNQPGTGHRQGQRVEIRDEDIIDWSYFKGRVLMGAYTERVLLDRIDPAQAAEIRRSYGW